MHTDVYPDRDTGEKRTSQKVTDDAIGYSPRFHTVTAQKNITPHRTHGEQTGDDHIDVRETSTSEQDEHDVQ
ncbi:MAG: hypothetical protein ACRDP8_13620 [Actinopolymorphaceae bacterium]